MKPVVRERIVTPHNATVSDRAAAWGDVERAQQTVNARAHTLDIPACEGYDAAVMAHFAVEGPPGCTARAIAYRVVSRAQQQINREARRHEWIDYIREELEALDKAIAWYHEIGGAETRVPGVGGIS